MHHIGPHLCSILILALSSIFAQIHAAIQITQPATNARTLALNPTPNLRWIYTIDDPETIGIFIEDVSSAQGQGLYRPGTPTNMSSVTLYFDEQYYKPGMNVTIKILDPTEHPEEVGRQAILDSVGPLMLVEGSGGIDPVEQEDDDGAMSSKSTSKSLSAVEQSTTTATTKTITITEAASDPSTGTATGTAETTVSATVPASSDAIRSPMFIAIYAIALVLLGVPALFHGLGTL